MEDEFELTDWWRHDTEDGGLNVLATPLEITMDEAAQYTEVEFVPYDDDDGEDMIVG